MLGTPEDSWKFDISSGLTPLSNLNQGKPRNMLNLDYPDVILEEGCSFHIADLTTLRGQVRGSSPLPCADLHLPLNGLYVNWLI